MKAKIFAATLSSSEPPPPPPPLFKLLVVRGRERELAGAECSREQLCVVDVPLLRTALLDMAPPRPPHRGLDEKASGAGVLAALRRTSQGMQKPWLACQGK